MFHASAQPGPTIPGYPHSTSFANSRSNVLAPDDIIAAGLLVALVGDIQEPRAMLPLHDNCK